MVNVVGRLIDAVKAEGPDSAIDVSDIAQRESFDVIGMVSHTAGPWTLPQSCVSVCSTLLKGKPSQFSNAPFTSRLAHRTSYKLFCYVCRWALGRTSRQAETFTMMQVRRSAWWVRSWWKP